MEAIPLKFWLTFMRLYRVLYKKTELYRHHRENLKFNKIHAIYVTLSITYKPRTADASAKQATDLSSSFKQYRSNRNGWHDFLLINF
jgi:hypothetical protein